MPEDATALLALKHAWQGVVVASDVVRALAPPVLGLANSTPLESVDLDGYHRAVLAQSISVMSLRGLIEELQRKRVNG